MQVDSYKFLPRSLRYRYDNLDNYEGPIPWAVFEKRLSEASICLLSSAGLSVKGNQPPFDLDGERQNPLWGDPTLRVLPSKPDSNSLACSHLHINITDIEADHNVALPSDPLVDLVNQGIVGQSSANHFSVMGYQDEDLNGWREQTLPELVELLRRQGSDGVVLAPV